MTDYGDADAREDAVAAVYARHLLVADVAREEDLFALGADSLMAAGILLDMERLFGLVIPQEVFVEEQSVRRMAAWIGAELDRRGPDHLDGASA